MTTYVKLVNSQHLNVVHDVNKLGIARKNVKLVIINPAINQSAKIQCKLKKKKNQYNKRQIQNQISHKNKLWNYIHRQSTSLWNKLLKVLNYKNI